MWVSDEIVAHRVTKIKLNLETRLDDDFCRSIDYNVTMQPLRRLFSDIFFWPVAMLLVFIGMVTALTIGMSQSVWFDEAYSILVAKQSAGDIVNLAAADTHPPLYYLIVHVWAGIFGWSELALRSLSVLAYGGAIFIAIILIRRLFDTRTALLTGGLLIIAPLLARYGFEIRMYSLAMLIGVCATYVLVRARAAKSSFWWWAGYSILLAVGLGTLYYLALLWIAHVTWLLIVERKKWRLWWRSGWVWSFVAGAALFLPQLPTFSKQVDNGALASIGQPMNLDQVVGIASFNSIYKPLWQVSVIETVLVLAMIGITIYAANKTYKKHKNNDGYLLLTLYWLMPIVVLMYLSLSRPMYVERYLSHTTIGLIMWLAVSLATVVFANKNRYQRYYFGAVAAICLYGMVHLATVGNFNFQRMQHPEIDKAAEQLTNCNDSTVIAADPYVATELSYYLPTSCVMKFYSQTAELGGGYAPFSNSPNQFSSLNIKADTKLMNYVYYGEPQLIIDDNYQQKSINDYGNMKIEVYEKNN